MINNIVNLFCTATGGIKRVVLLSVLTAGVPAQDAVEITPFQDATAGSGVDFIHFNGMSGELYFQEHMGSGAALFDYDNDGDLDLYLVQGDILGPGKTFEDALFKPRHPLPLSDRLYRNDSSTDRAGKHRIVFTDVTKGSGVDRTSGYGMGVAAGDFDNDGWIDLYVTTYGDNYLLHNQGDGTFRDVTERAGTREPRWSVSASWFDYDRDGLLDLFVGNYIDLTFDNLRPCYTPAVVREYCGPLSYEPSPDTLFRNLGDGRFEDVSKQSGISSAFGGALGVITADFNGDGWIDVYVANDGTSNQMWINQQNGKFVDDAMFGGTAVNMDGIAEASMGVDAADFDGDGDEDLFMTHLNRESNTLYVNDGEGLFEDMSLATGLAQTSMTFTGFGMGFLDYDNDGWLDIVIANGEVRRIPEQVEAGDPLPLRQKNQLFRNLANGRFQEVSETAGSAFQLKEVSRGIAFGDIDNDGDQDFLITNNNGPARLFINQLGQDQNWLGLRLLGRDGKRDALGARAALLADGEPSLWRRVRADGSYASSNDPRVLFGLGKKTGSQSILVQWPDGSREHFADLAPRSYHTLRQGAGIAPE